MKKMKDYQIFRCPYCSCEYYDRTATKGKKVGDPIIVCPQCSKQSYRNTILEPALLSGNRFFDINFSSLYGNIRIALIVIYAIFLFMILIKRSLVLGICLICVSVALYSLYELARVFHRNSFLKSQEYEKELTYSLERLSDEDYAQLVIGMQGVDDTSVYYYNLQNAQLQGTERF